MVLEIMLDKNLFEKAFLKRYTLIPQHYNLTLFISS